MKQLEENIMNSFRLAKKDIINIQNEIIRLSQTQERIMEMLDELRSDEFKLDQKVKDVRKKASAKPRTKIVVKKVAKRAHKEFVAKKDGKRFHEVNCPFAQNIKPKNRVHFKSRTNALNTGYKACNCVK